MEGPGPGGFMADNATAQNENGSEGEEIEESHYGDGVTDNDEGGEENEDHDGTGRQDKRQANGGEDHKDDDKRRQS